MQISVAISCFDRRPAWLFFWWGQLGLYDDHRKQEETKHSLGLFSVADWSAFGVLVSIWQQHGVCGTESVTVSTVAAPVCCSQAVIDYWSDSVWHRQWRKSFHPAGRTVQTKQIDVGASTSSGRDQNTSTWNQLMTRQGSDDAHGFTSCHVLQWAPTCWFVGDSNKLHRSSDVNLDPGWVTANSSSWGLNSSLIRLSKSVHTNTLWYPHRITAGFIKHHDFMQIKISGTNRLHVSTQRQKEVHVEHLLN